jgi:hypothetical protein
MNLEQITDEINKDLDDTVDSEDVLGWINRCVDDLSPIAKQESKQTIEITTTNSYELPEDLGELVLVLVNGEPYEAVVIGDSTSIGYQLWGKSLSLRNGAESGQIELFYYQRLAHLAETEDVPAIDEAFHDLFILYTVGHHQFADDEVERQNDALSRYYRRKNEFEAFMRRNTVRFNPKHRIKNVYSSNWGS